MGHIIQAIIAQPETLVETVRRFQHAHLVRLENDLAMIPATEELLEELLEELETTSEAQSAEDFDYLTSGLHALLCEISHHAPVVYIETEYFGGDGSQSAAAYEGGAQALAESDRRVPCDRDYPSTWPINRALAYLGIRGIFPDAFDQIGLRRFRSIDDALHAAER